MTHHISERKKEAILQHFIVDVSATKTAKLLGVSRMCVNDWFRKWREAIYARTRVAPRLEGEVEIDIGFFSGRASKHTTALVRRLAGLPAGRIVAKRKTVVREQRKKQMVLGFLRRGGDLHLRPIRSKARAFLESEVRLVVAKGSIVYSDMEKGLSKLKLQGYTHRPINHSLEYVTKKGFHINGIESAWREMKQAMVRNFRGIPRNTLMLHIKEREARFNHSDFGAYLRNIL